MMTLEEFQKYAIIHVEYHWRGDFLERLLKRLNNREQCAKILRRCEKFSDRWCISTMDAFHHLVTSGCICRHK